MFRHVVMFEWNDGVDDAQIASIGRALDERVAVLPSVAEYRHGPDAGLADGNAQYVIVADFATVEDYVEYRDHADHQAVIAEHLKPAIASRSAVQYDAG